MAQWLLGCVDGLGHTLLVAVPMTMIVVATANLGPRQGLQRVFAMSAAVVLSAGCGALLRLAYGALQGGNGEHLASMFRYVWPRYALLGGILTVAWEFYRRERSSLDAAHQADIDRIALGREMAEARLQVLQAQIEPHFLFNTLANVRRLYEENRHAGRTMLEKLMEYLEVALPRMRSHGTTLQRDAELVDAYLHIQRVRMEDRLVFSIDIPAPLRGHEVPPLMLLTLVENAIKHGLSASPDGGRIRLSARVEREQLLLTVADTGVGFSSGSGAGVGLANVRARLAEEFGNRASLAAQNNDLGGATATIALPLRSPIIAG